MSEMVERVAASMYAAHHNIAPDATFAMEFGPFATDEWYRLALAAIAAMREPTEEMVEAGGSRNGVLTITDEVRKVDAQTWRLMIDAALK